jgi:hypothetical protein
MNTWAGNHEDISRSYGTIALSSQKVAKIGNHLKIDEALIGPFTSLTVP